MIIIEQEQLINISVVIKEDMTGMYQIIRKTQTRMKLLIQT